MPNINYNKIVVQSQEVIKIKKEADKNLKLSQGMINALNKMEKEVDNLQKQGQ